MTFKPDETYLGDGLYASCDGYQIKLRAPRVGGDHEVFMDNDTWIALVRFVHKLSKGGEGSLD